MVDPVLFIAPYPGLAETARKAARSFNGPVSVVEGDLQMGLDLARERVTEGVELVISRGGTARLLGANLQVPVVEVKVTAYDILEALGRVPPSARKIGIIGFENVIHGATKLGRLLNIEIVVLPIKNEGEVDARLEDAAKAQVDAIIGDQVVVSEGDCRGLEAVLIESGVESVAQSLFEARDILEAVRAEAEKSRELLAALNQLKAVLDAVDEQMVILDSQNLVQSCNPAALKLLRKSLTEIHGKPLAHYPTRPLAQVQHDGRPVRNHLASVLGLRMLLDYLPIETAGERIGTLIVGRNASTIEQAERKLRNELYDKGYVARYTFDNLITQDDSFREILDRARSFAASDATVLIIGETGTGKELFAQSIHNARGATSRPFVAINCATLPEPLLESELFGYAPGAFTGARNKRKKGFFELAHGGTILLDEIGEMPLNLQSRLLRVIEERVVQPLGDDRVIPITVRVMASTNRDLALEVQERRFRADLFYRLNVLQLSIPPLRQRGKDPFVLFKHFVEQIKPDCDRKQIFPTKVARSLCGYAWPGNVRELRNVVERLATLTTNFTNISGDLSKWLDKELKQSLKQAMPATETGEEPVSLKALERAWIQEMCTSSSLTQVEMAKLLGVSRTTLWKMRKKD